MKYMKNFIYYFLLIFEIIKHLISNAAENNLFIKHLEFICKYFYFKF